MVEKTNTEENSFGKNVFSGFLKISFRNRVKYKKMWFKFSRNPLSLIGLIVCIVLMFMVVFAPFITPYPDHVGFYTNFKEKNIPPNSKYLFGTDTIGRDVLTRCVFGIRYSLMMGAVVLTIVVPLGSLMGMTAGFYSETWIDMLIMRIADIFLALPPLILAMAVAAVLKPNLFNAMLAICATWWPWYSRLIYGQTKSIRHEFYIQSAEIIGASSFYIIFYEILPNILLTILTKMTLDIGTVILIGASLSFVGLGAQAPTPDLGTMVSEGSRYLPEIWWTTIFPALFIIVIILSFNLLGDGIRDMFSTEVL